MKTCLTFVIGFLLTSSLFGQTCTLTLHPNGSQGTDAMIVSNYPDSNEAATSEFVVAGWTVGGNVILRSLLQFDLTSLPATAQVQQATVTLFNDPNCSQALGNGEHTSLTGSNEAWLQRVNAPWNENTVTWNNQPGTDTLHQAILPQSVTPHQDYSIDVTAMAQNMVANPSQNYGFMLLLQDETPYRALVFASSDHPDSTNWPTLEITYTVALDDSIVAGGATDLCDGGSAVLHAVPAIGTSYQWQRNGTDISGATDSVYTAFAGGAYSCIVTNCGGSDTSLSIQVTVTTVDTVVTMSPGILNAQAINSTYQWIDCGTGLPTGVTTNFFNPWVTGTYSVVVTTNGCTDTSGCHYVFPIGIPDIGANHGILLYPNPSRDLIRVEAQGKHVCMEKLEVRNVLGALLKEELKPACQEATIDIQSLASGIYFLTILQGEDEITLRFAKD